ncbi:DUF6387 family protein [Methylomonas rivi]|uniref:DUF6387 family protein n=1 Tax=Methylomonas rivi TaxID=2952226 RepID=A0ABT1U2U1_9GAMM|nr:DUF6387 family protein [Methylomonas sp. WSC-6]MCQ8128154.1 DUF6387 family protein [Methylomonas sp. WSC-6]
MKKSPNLPNWFKLESYYGMETLTPKEWLENLSERQFFLSSLEYSSSIDASFADKYFQGIITDPLRNKRYWAEGLQPSSAVSTLTNLGACTIAQTLKFTAPQSVLSIKDYKDLVRHSRRSLFDENTKEYLQSDFRDRTSHTRVTVNLYANDEQIIADFKKWLEKVRQDKNLVAPKKLFNEVDFKEWAEYMILPYLDLIIWSKYNEIKITQPVLGNVLFPDEIVDTTERIRRTIKPKAEWLMQESTINALALQLSSSV